MKVQELLANIHNKDFNLEKGLQVKKYLPFELKKTIAQGIIFESTDDSEGFIKVDSIQQYLSYVRFMILHHTNLEYTDEDYDKLCSTEYKDGMLLNAIMGCFEEDAKECTRILKLATADYMQHNSLENSVIKILGKFNTSLNSFINKFGEKFDEIDLKSIIPEDTDMDKLNKFLNEYIK